MLRKPLYCILQSVLMDEASLLLTSIANAAYDSEQVQANNGLFRLEFLHRAGEQFRVCE